MTARLQDIVRTAQAVLVATLLVAAGATGADAQSSGNVDATLDTLFGAHEPYRQFLDSLKKAVAEDDRAQVAAMVAYPFHVRIDGKVVTLRDQAGFVTDYDRIVTPKVKQAIAGQSYATLFANDQGVMIGDGEVWFSGVGSNAVVRITAINR